MNLLRAKYHDEHLVQRIRLFESGNFIEIQQDNLEKCLICFNSKRDTILKPCNHIVACNTCSAKCKRCPICKINTSDCLEIETCQLCNQKRSSILFEPCGHYICCKDCSSLLKNCIKCKNLIENFVPHKELCLSKNDLEKNSFLLEFKSQLTKGKEMNRMKKQVNILKTCVEGRS